MPFLAYGITQRKVGCVMLQAVLGGDSEIAQRIDTVDWLFAPSADLKVYRLTDEQVEHLVVMHATRREVSVR